MAEDDDSMSMFLFLIVMIVMLVAKQIYDLYKKYTKNYSEIYFVMMGQPNCCKPYENPGASDRCTKYCAGKLLMKITNRIQSAKSSICIAMYNFSNHRFADYILGAHNRGVKVRLIIDKTACENADNKTQAKRLKNAGVSVRISGEKEKLMHHKFCLIDGTSPKGILITGSLNWTYGGLSKNFENVAFINNQRVKHQYRDAFDLIWNKYSKPYNPLSANA